MSEETPQKEKDQDEEEGKRKSPKKKKKKQKKDKEKGTGSAKRKRESGKKKKSKKKDTSELDNADAKAVAAEISAAGASSTENTDSSSSSSSSSSTSSSSFSSSSPSTSASSSSVDALLSESKGSKLTKKRASDFSDEVDEKLPQWHKAAKDDPSQLNSLLTKYLALEKTTRLANDVDSTLKICLGVLQICFELKEWKTLNDHISILCKRRAQSIEKTVAGIIKQAYEYVDQMPDEETTLALIDVLRTVSAGKIVVEKERARLTKRLSKMKEEKGDLKKASEILQEVQVETIGSMETREKADFLLEQIRLCLATKDFVRVEIIANKINESDFKDSKLEDLKLKHFTQMIEYYTHEKEYLKVCRAYQQIYDTPTVKEDEKKWKPALAAAAFFLALSPYDHDVDEIFHLLHADKNTKFIDEAWAIVLEHTSSELATWPVPHAERWKQQQHLQSIFSDAESTKEIWELLQKRIVQHNLRVVGGIYERIPISRLAGLLHLSAEKSEEYICEMVSSQQLYARIDRPAGVVSFTRPKAAADIVHSWSEDISQLLSLVERTCNDINKENMMQKVRNDEEKAAKKAAAARRNKE